MTRRSPTASFAPGAYVFPGGGIDAADAQAHAHRRAPARPGRPAPDAGHRRHPRKLRRAGRAAGPPCRWPARRRAGHRRHWTATSRFVAQCRARGLVLAADQVFVLAHWITDRDLPRRFDVPFLVARMPEGQAPVADEAEQFEPVWVRPADALARHEAGSFFMIFPTIRTLERLAQFDSVRRGAAGLRRRAAAVDQLPARRACCKGAEARYMEHETALRRTGAGQPRRPDRAPPRLAQRPAGAAAART